MTLVMLFMTVMGDGNGVGFCAATETAKIVKIAAVKATSRTKKHRSQPIRPVSIAFVVELKIRKSNVCLKELVTCKLCFH